MIKIYLSPSRQKHNMYKGIYSHLSERDTMVELAIYMERDITKYEEVKVKIATLSMEVQDRVIEAKNWGADIYMALHTNAAGTSPSTARGPIALVHPDNKECMTLSKLLVDRLKEITPHGTNRSKDLWGSTGTYEVKHPHNYGMTPVYLEIDFHDNEKTAKYIVESIPTISLALAKGLQVHKGWKEKDPLNIFYRVQTGAFKEKKNAEKMQQDLINDGYTGAFIRKVEM